MRLKSVLMLCRAAGEAFNVPLLFVTWRVKFGRGYVCIAFPPLHRRNNVHQERANTCDHE